MDSKYNVYIRYLGDGEFKFSVKRVGEISITKDKPVYLYNADIETINNLRTLRRMLIEITIGGKPEGAYKILNLEDYDREKNALNYSRVDVDRRGINVMSNSDINSILKSGSNGPIVDEVSTAKTEETKSDVSKSKITKKTTKKSTKKSSSKK